jgi:putative Mg2+ transporter-C (MgtC) family protein
MLDIYETVLRLAAAAGVGAMIGLNRDLHGKPTGARTLGLVALGAAIVTVATLDAVGQPGSDKGDLSRVMQGLLTGIGFVGAGVIIHEDAAHRVRGLTTAACVWVTACIGMICGIGNWKVLVLALCFVAAVLFLGGPLERIAHRIWRTPDNPAPDV